MESPGSLYLNGTALWVLCDVWVQQVVMAASFSCVCFSGLLRGPALEMVHPATSSSRFALLFWQFTSKTPCLLEPLTLPGGSLVSDLPWPQAASSLSGLDHIWSLRNSFSFFANRHSLLLYSPSSVPLSLVF